MPVPELLVVSPSVETVIATVDWTTRSYTCWASMGVPLGFSLMVIPSSLGVTSTSGSFTEGWLSSPSWEGVWDSSGVPGCVSTTEFWVTGPATAQLITKAENPMTVPATNAEAIHKNTLSPRDIFFRGGLERGWP